MAKEVNAIIKLQCPAGQATPNPHEPGPGPPATEESPW